MSGLLRAATPPPTGASRALHSQPSTPSSSSSAKKRKLGRSPSGGNGTGSSSSSLLSKSPRRTYGRTRSIRAEGTELAATAGEDDLLGVLGSPSSQTRKGSSALLSNATGSALLSVTDDSQPRETYSTLYNKWGIGHEEELGAEAAADVLGMSSKTQMRSKGESTRFEDDVGYLLEGLGDEMSAQVRRSSAVEVLRRVVDEDEGKGGVLFLNRLNAAGYVERLFNVFRGAGSGADGTQEQDETMDLALAFLLALMFGRENQSQKVAMVLLRLVDADDVDAEEGAQGEKQASVIAWLAGALKRAGDRVGKTPKKVKRGKAEATTLKGLEALITKSSLLDRANSSTSLPPTLLTLTLLTVSLLSSLPPKPPLFKPQEDLSEHPELVGAVLSILSAAAEQEDTETAFLALQCLEHLLPHPLPLLAVRAKDLAKPVAFLLAAAFEQAKDGKGKKRLESVLKVAIEVTTVEVEWCVALASASGPSTSEDEDEEEVGAVETLVRVLAWCVEPPAAPSAPPPAKKSGTSANEGRKNGRSPPKRARLMRKDDEDDVEATELESDDDDEGSATEEEGDGEVAADEDEGRKDVLCLALGVLANIVEASESARESVRLAQVGPESKQVSGTRRMVELYLDPLRESENEVERAFIKGYTGILLGLLMLDNTANENIILPALPAGKGEGTIRALCDTMEQFAELHEENERVEEQAVADAAEAEAKEEVGEEDANSDEEAEAQLGVVKTEGKLALALPAVIPKPPAAKSKQEGLANQIRGLVKRLREE